MYTLVYKNGKRVMFSNCDCLLVYLLLKCPKMQLHTFSLILDWIDNDDASLPFCWISFYITKE